MQGYLTFLAVALSLLACAVQASPGPEAPDSAVMRPVARPVQILRAPVAIETRQPDVRPVARPRFQPRARWDGAPGGRVWSRAAMTALAEHAAPLTGTEPRDIATWCPEYSNASIEERRAFWGGLVSALAKYESTYRPRAVGGGDRWFGLLQILPDTARRYGCRARTPDALLDPADNLSCAARIMAVTVPRDQAVALFDERWRGVAADWGPMQDRAKVAEMAAWTARQSYCVPLDGVRPITRPASISAPAAQTRPPG